MLMAFQVLRLLLLILTIQLIVSMEYISSVIFCGIGEIAQFVEQHSKWSTEIAPWLSTVVIATDLIGGCAQKYTYIFTYK